MISHTGLPDGLYIINTVPDSSPGALNLPKPPLVAEIRFSGIPGLYTTTIVGGPCLSEHQAKMMVRDALDKIGGAGTLPTEHIDFEAFSDHSPLQLRVSSEELEAGFYKKLYALQGGGALSSLARLGRRTIRLWCGCLLRRVSCRRYWLRFR